jgi:hypothetical protein
MQIRHAQMTVFEDGARQQFEAELLDHARSFAPELAEVAGESKLRTVVAAAVERGSDHGFSDRGPVRLFLEMLLSLGWGFDTDPLLPWAAAALGDTSDQHRRAERLYSASRDYYSLVAGQNDEYTVAALRRAIQLTAGHLRNMSGAIDQRIQGLLRSVYPEKYAYAGKAAVAGLLSLAGDTAAGYGVTDDTGRAIIAGTLFSFGHQVFSDPLYAWVSACMDSPGSGEERTSKLHRLLNGYFERMISVLEGA